MTETGVAKWDAAPASTLDLTLEKTTYEAFEASSVENRRRLRQEGLIVDVTEALSEMLEQEGITKAELARRLGKTKATMTDLFSGKTNLTLRTIADVADALGFRWRIAFEREGVDHKRRRPAVRKTA